MVSKCTVIITTFLMSLQSATSQLVHLPIATQDLILVLLILEILKFSTWRADDFSKIQQNKK